MSRVLLLHASSYGQTHKIAETIAERLRDHGRETVVADLNAAAVPTPEAFDAVVLGSRIQFGKHAGRALDYIRRHRTALERRPSFFYSVSNLAADKALAPDPGGYIARVTHDTGWLPVASAAFAGALAYTAYNPLLRLVMKWISRSEGRPTDTHRDHELTDWGQVVDFADRIAHELSALDPIDLAVSRM
jgi:menaquinone-dependent protoporphyrinogen oxidase